MTYQVSVRTLAEFTGKSGDLDLRFTPSPSSIEGILGHSRVQASRGPDYRREVRLHGYYPGLKVSGRCDGYDPSLNRLEEIKTHRSHFERIPDNQRALHWTQAKLYGWLMCLTQRLPRLTVCVVYLNVLTQEETLEEDDFSAEQLQYFFNQQCDAFLGWAEQETAHRQRRTTSLQALTFPYKDYRKGQRQLAEAVYRGVSQQRTVLAQATTGIGKTLGTLFPQLKAMGELNTDRIFFLTAKTPGRQLALEALNTLRRHCFDLNLRSLELVSREKACLHRDKVCYGESCPLARGFYDRLPAARRDAIRQRTLSHDQLQRIAAEHALCPYFLGQEMAKWSDVVVGDYNYYFDMQALLYALTVVNQWQVTVLVDEAHNLIDRGRAMYTATLRFEDLAAAQAQAARKLKPAFDHTARRWLDTLGQQHEPYAIIEALPEPLQREIQKLVSVITDHLSEQPAGQPAELMQFYFEALRFLRLAEHLGEHALIDHQHDTGHPLQVDSTLAIRNLMPDYFLRPRFEHSRSTTLFSATLTPAAFYCDLLGLPDNTMIADVPSPFHAGQLSVRVASHISTREKDRAHSLNAVCDVIARQFRDAPGNYLVFFSSYKYLSQVLAQFNHRAPDIPCRIQDRDMSEQRRTDFLLQFTENSQQVGFCVLGGIFGEGIDLPGERLKGAFITTLGLPAPSPLNDVLTQRLAAKFGNGYDYTFLYPGIQKVVQAAGRVIRSETDRGVVWLLDDRYRQPQIQRLLPAWWSLKH